MKKRRFLLTAGTATAVVLAGCSGNDESDNSEDSQNGDESQNGTDTETGDESQNNQTGGGDSGGEIAVGETVDGTLGQESPRSPYQESIAVPYTLEVDQHQRVRISHESDQFDTQLILTDENDEIVQRNSGSTSLADDDEPPGNDSLLLPLLSPEKTYTVWAGKDGFVTEPAEFTLSVGGPSEVIGDAPEITLGETVTTDGEAAVANPNRPSQLSYSLKVPYRLDLDEQKRVGIEAGWTTVTDTQGLPVTEAEGEPSGSYQVFLGSGADDFTVVERGSYTGPGEAYDEGVVTFTSDYGEMTLSAGEYVVWADPGTELTVREPIPVAETIADAPDISPGESVTGELTQEPPRDPQTHAYADPYTFEGTAGQVIYAELTGEYTDPWLLLTDDEGGRLSVDASRIRESWDIERSLPEDGTYVLWVRSRASDTGAYELSLEAATVPDETRRISVGETVTAEITDESPRDPVRNDRAIPYLLDGGDVSERREELDRQERLVTEIRLESDEFDPLVYVTNGLAAERERGETDGEQNVTQLPADPHDGFILWAGSQTGFKTGSFTLTTEHTVVERGDGR